MAARTKAQTEVVESQGERREPGAQAGLSGRLVAAASAPTPGDAPASQRSGGLATSDYVSCCCKPPYCPS